MPKRRNRKRKCSEPRCCWHQGSKGRTSEGWGGIGGREARAAEQTLFWGHGSQNAEKNWRPQDRESRHIRKLFGARACASPAHSDFRSGGSAIAWRKPQWGSSELSPGAIAFQLSIRQRGRISGIEPARSARYARKHLTSNCPTDRNWQNRH